MRLTAIVFAVLLPLSTACVIEEDSGPDPDVDPVVWNCSAAASCDGGGASETSRECGTSDDIEDMVDDFKDQCRDDLAPVCVQFQCSMSCSPTPDEC
jgi:hypothetical protein